jgi:cyclopropane fatty-acyl-phospholipid synthase-like methyltransferase
LDKENFFLAVERSVNEAGIALLDFFTQARAMAYEAVVEANYNNFLTRWFFRNPLMPH